MVERVSGWDRLLVCKRVRRLNVECEWADPLRHPLESPGRRLEDIFPVKAWIEEASDKMMAILGNQLKGVSGCFRIISRGTTSCV
jgi:hypothetical protein